MREVDLVEKSTQLYLESLNLGQVLPFPNGKNMAPDFRMNGRIAVEATRLVKIVRVAEESVNLTEIEPQYSASFQNAVTSIKSAQFSGNYFVSISYDLPLQRLEAAKSIRSYLFGLSIEAQIFPHTKRLQNGVRLTILASSNTYGSPFIFGGANCILGGGLVLQDLIDESRRAMLRKAHKLRHLTSDFDEFWIAVSSHLTIWVDEDYLRIISDEVKVASLFSRLLLINPLEPRRSKTVFL